MKHILVVDDKPDVTTMFQMALELYGYRVSVADDGARALDIDMQDPVDAIISDLRMPRMNGKELVARLRARRPELPAIIVSGYAAEEDLSGQNVKVLTKPVSLESLTGELDELLDGGAVGSPHH